MSDPSLATLATQKDAFTFPSLGIADIGQCLRELGLPFSDQEIQKPTGDVRVCRFCYIKDFFSL